MPVLAAEAMSATEWRDIPGYEGLYQVSDEGCVRSLRRGVLKQRPNRSGYPAVNLYKAGAASTQPVHRVVATTFLSDSYFPGSEVCHNDGNPNNNAVGNLRWGTRSDNIRDSVKHGTHANHRKTHCSRGHLFDDDNTNITTTAKSGGPQRNCRTCNREAVRRRRAESKMAAAS
jgi:hypothetical protein